MFRYPFKLSDNLLASSIIPTLTKFINIIALPLGIVLSPISIGLKISLLLKGFFEIYFYQPNKIFLALLIWFFSKVLYLKFMVLSDKSLSALIKKA